MMERSYLDEMQQLAKELGYLIIWNTNVGNPINQLYKLLGISRASHDAYLKNSESVPSYIWNQLDILQSLRPHQRLEHGFNTLTNVDNLSIKEALNLAISGWERMTGRPITQESNMGKVGRFSLTSSNRQLVKLLEEDSTGIAASLYLLNNTKKYNADYTYDFNAIYNGCVSSNRAALGAKQIELFLTKTEIGTAISQFDKKCRSIITHYKPESKVDDDLINEAIELLIDAKKEFNRLPKFTISKNALCASNQTLKIQEQIFVFESVADLIDHSTLLPNGFSLNMIRAARATDSFFCIVVKSGENIHLITDKPAYSEAQKDKFSARNQRYNMFRFENTYFPYEMMQFIFSDNGRRIEESQCTDIVVQQDGLRVLGHFKSMSQAAVIWFTFLFEECKEAFFNGNSLALPDMGYVDLERVNHPLISSNTSDKTSLPISYVAKGVIDQKPCSQLNRKEFERTNPGAKKTVHWNKWMIDKFSDQVDDSLIYIPDTVLVNDALCIEDKSGKLTLSVSSDSKELGLPEGFRAIPATLIGTPESVQSEIDSIARQNKATAIYNLALADFQEREEEMQKWFARKVKANLSNLVDKLVALDHDYFSITDEMNAHVTDLGLSNTLYHVLRQVHVAKHSGVWDFRRPLSMLQKTLKTRNSKNIAKCAMTKWDMPSYCFYLNVGNAFDLEKILGIPRKKMPIEIRNYRLSCDAIQDDENAFYDPLDAMSNPWDQIEFALQIPLDSDFVKDRRKELGIKERFIVPSDYYDPKYGRKMHDQLLEKAREPGYIVGTINYSNFKPRFYMGASGD